MRIIKLGKILRGKKISQLSPFLLIAKELNLKYLIEKGGLIIGPAIGLSILVDKLTSTLPIKSMLDLCCGTGALTKIAQKNGVEEIVCVDENTKAVKENIVNKEDVKIIKADVLKLEVKEFFDLIVLDAPRELLPKLFHKFKNFISNSHIFVLWHGGCEEIEWNEKVREILREAANVVYSFSIYGEEISACSSTQKGIKWLKNFYNRW